MQKIAFYTLGCKANQYQTEVLKSQLTTDNLPAGRQGSQLTTFDSLADVYVINTCTVTEDADRKSRQAIRRALRQNPKAKIIVAGCYARLESDYLMRIFPNINILDNQNVALPRTNEGEASFATTIQPRIRSFLMIQDGCEHYCSYCIVPYARGKIKSKPPDEVISEAKQLVKSGAREIILTGINLGTYQYDLSSVVSRLSSVDGLLRIRLSSIEPMYLTKELIDKVAETPKVCHHLHLPLQSGDDNILKSMNRNYTREYFLELVNYIRRKMPDCGITTDIIVGFPGEGEKEFQNTVDLIKQIKFSRLHIFTYSKRKETPAAEFPNQVDIETKKQRSKVLHELRKEYMTEFAGRYLNREVEILVEQKGEGLTSNYIRCFFNDPADSSGNLRKIFARLVTNSGEIRE